MKPTLNKIDFLLLGITVLGTMAVYQLVVAPMVAKKMAPKVIK